MFHPVNSGIITPTDTILNDKKYKIASSMVYPKSLGGS